jgi:stage III sporulation protein AD
MDIYLKAIGGVLVALMLCLALGNRGKEFAVLLALMVSAMVIMAGLSYFSSVLDFFTQLQSLIGLDNDLLNVLLKAVGVGLIGEIAGLICADGGQAALGKAVQILTSGIILWVSLPLYSQILKLVEELLSGL